MHRVLDLQNVSLRRDQSWLVQDVSWTIEAGSTVALLGPNGSGKSTLARIIMGYLWPTEGEVTVLGQRFGETDLHHLRKSIQFVQPGGSFEVDTNLTLRQVVLTGYTSTLVLRFEPDESQLDAANRMLEIVGLEHLADRRYMYASSVERVRALIARALLNTPKLLILDEPTSGLDLLGREHLLSLIDELRDSVNSPELAILMITHHTEELPSNTSEVLLLQQGRAFASGPIDQVLTSENLSALYRFPIRVHHEHGRFYTMVQSKAK